MTVLIKALQLILSLSLLVFVHELGHFMFARLFKTRVDKFYLFFNPKFAIVRWKKINGKWRIKWFSKNWEEFSQPILDENGYQKLDKKGNPMTQPLPTDQLPEDDWRRYPETTEWGIGWLPLGGYCSICGMVDETTSINDLNEKAEPWEYRSKPAWQRLLIITGGVLMNFVTAVVVYSIMLFHWGSEEMPMRNAYLGYNYCKTALNNGFENGDIIISINNGEVETEKDAVEKIVIENKREILINRNGNETLILLPEGFGEQMLAAEEKQFMELRIPFVIDEVVGQNKMLQKGDSVIAINNKKTSVYQDITKEISSLSNTKINISFFRNGILMSDSIMLDENGKIGVSIKNPIVYFKTIKKEYNILQSIPAGWNMMVDVLSSYVKQFRLVFTKEGAKSLGGFAAIGNLFPSVWDWQIFWNMTAFLSVILAFMNILPIPVLDGGYVLFLLYEMIFRRKPSEKFMQIALNIGMFLLLTLLILANGNDVIKMFK
ncbi:MAG: RIP metalloprotease RseP [Paludibacteraceae bacterium]|nr:RIP metalloprotease RseP [Paludibacteraceae bacterium]